MAASAAESAKASKDLKRHPAASEAGQRGITGR